jgi:ribonuclease E
MTRTMLIDASHAEETRVVVLDGSKLDDFDIESAGRKQIKGNIYLAKVIRVEPSLQAAFVEYGGNRHGFLAFAEIHPDYYQIPVADRERLVAAEAAEAKRRVEAEEAEDAAQDAVQDARDGQRQGDQKQGDQKGRGRSGVLPLAQTRVEIRQAPPPDTGSDTGPNDGPLEQGPLEQALLDQDGLDQAGDDGDGLGFGPIGDIVGPDGRVQTGQAAYEGVDFDADPTAIALPGDEFGTLDEPSPVSSDPETQGMIDPVSAAMIEAAEAPSSGVPDEVATEGLDADARNFGPGISDAGYLSEADRVEQGLDAHETKPGDAADYQLAGTGPQPDMRLPDTSSPDTSLDVAMDYTPPETVGGGEGDAGEEAREVRRARPMRSYKIQEVIHRRQILLIQVVKEERGSKGAALTTYLSLAGRFSVLMPNSPNGGGVSRKITSMADRRRLKEAVAELDIPDGMGLIVRTAGANRPKPEIKRDCEYLLRLWDDIRERTLASVAPALIYEEANLIKRTIRDVYTREVDQVLVEGEEGYRSARDFMAMLMPQQVKKVQEWTDGQPLFAKHQVEAQLDQMFQPVVQLKSGGYLVINQTEALVAIDVNSGRSTRERNIEDTAVRTNLEAAEEVARQLRLRDLAGLVVIDFIDMESRRNNGLVERKLKDALKNDRARIQVGSISPFGLMEMSRQRLRPSLAEAMLIPCPHCAGAGHVRSVATLALAVLRGIEDEAAKKRAAELAVHLAPDVAIYMFNHKRERLSMIETRFGVGVTFVHDEKAPAAFRIETIRVQSTETKAEYAPLAMGVPEREAEPEFMSGIETDNPDLASMSASETALEMQPAPDRALLDRTLDRAGEKDGDESERRGRRRRRRRRPRREDGPAEAGQLNGDQDNDDQAVQAGDAAQPDPVPETTAHDALLSPDMPEAAVPEPVSALTAELEAALESTIIDSVGTDSIGGETSGLEALEAVPEEAEKPRRRPRGRPRSKKAGEAPAEAPPAEARPAEAPADMPVYANIADIFEAAERAERAVQAGAIQAGAVQNQATPTEPAAEPILEAGVETTLAGNAAPEAPLDAVPVETAAMDAEAGPAVQPVIIGSQNGEPAEKKRGWWRR